MVVHIIVGEHFKWVIKTGIFGNKKGNLFL